MVPPTLYFKVLLQFFSSIKLMQIQPMLCYRDNTKMWCDIGRFVSSWRYIDNSQNNASMGIKSHDHHWWDCEHTLQYLYQFSSNSYSQMSAVFLNTVCSWCYPHIRKGEITQWVLLPKQKQTQFLDIPNSDDWERKADPFLTLTTLISPSFNLCCRVRGGECILQVKKGELIVFFHFTQRICRKSCICLYHLSCLGFKQADTTINLLKICNRKMGSNISFGGTFDWFSSTVWVWQNLAKLEMKWG